jgi:SAM-dependent methyltransferase
MKRILRTLHLWELAFALRKFIFQFLHVDVLRGIVAALRYVVYAVILRRMRTLELSTGNIVRNTLRHNMSRVGTFREFATPRPKLLLYPLSALRVSRSTPVLSVGPRTEGEILSLMSLGFHNVRALDLISYSPWMDLGDMHAMPYQNDQFGIVVMGWVIAYSTNRQKAAEEAVRVTRDGGIIAVGAQYAKESAKEASKRLGYDIPLTPIQSVDEILSYFSPFVDHVFVSVDRTPGVDKCDIMAIFSVKKQLHSP